MDLKPPESVTVNNCCGPILHGFGFGFNSGIRGRFITAGISAANSRVRCVRDQMDDGLAHPSHRAIPRSNVVVVVVVVVVVIVVVVIDVVVVVVIDVVVVVRKNSKNVLMATER